MKKRLLIIIVTLCSILMGAASANASAGSFTIYPSRTHDGNKSWIIAGAEPGGSIQDSLTLENLTGERQPISLEITEASTEHGQFTPAFNRPYRDVGNWISVPQSSYLLEPYAKVKVPLTISVPDHAPYDRYQAAIFAVKKEKNLQGINIVTRIGVRVYLDVPAKSAGFTSVFGTPEYKSTFFFAMSLAGLLASFAYYLINLLETKKYEKQKP